MKHFHVIRKAGVLLVVAAVFAAFMPMIGGGQVHAQSIKLNKKTVYLTKGDTYELKISGTLAKVKWSSSSKKIATVSKKGKVTAKRLGKATITAKVKGKKYKCKVIVERKAAHKARLLRSYIMKNGVSNDAKTRFTIQNTYMEGENTVKVSITAYKGEKELLFKRSCEYSPENPPADTFITAMTIDLISGKAEVKNGTLRCVRIDGELNGDGAVYNGKISTRYKGTKTGLTLKKAVLTEDDEVTTVKKSKDLKKMLGSFNEQYIATSFLSWNDLIKSQKDLTGISMRSIGFKNWSEN